MSTRVNYDEESGVLHLRFDGPVDTQTSGTTLDEVVEQVKSRHAKKILVDARKMTRDMPLLELHLFGKRLASISELEASQIALLCEAIDKKNEYVALVAENRGARIRSFDDVEQARKWLSGN